MKQLLLIIPLVGLTACQERDTTPQILEIVSPKYHTEADEACRAAIEAKYPGVEVTLQYGAAQRGYLNYTPDDENYRIARFVCNDLDYTDEGTDWQIIGMLRGQ